MDHCKNPFRIFFINSFRAISSIRFFTRSFKKLYVFPTVLNLTMDVKILPPNENPTIAKFKLFTTLTEMFFVFSCDLKRKLSDGKYFNDIPETIRVTKFEG